MSRRRVPHLTAWIDHFVMTGQTHETRDTLWLCEPDWTPHLRAELRQEFPGIEDRRLSPGLIAGRIDLPSASSPPSVSLARQSLPNSIPLAASSIADWAELIGRNLIERLPEGVGNWRLHLLAGDGNDAPRPGRLKLIAAALDDFLRRKQRRLRRTLVADPETPWSDAPNLAQTLFTTPSCGFLSVCLADERERCRRLISRFPGGVVEPAIDKSAPARAFAKLAEALTEWGTDIEPGNRVVDLGASPGSWSWLAIERGARVTAIDRSPVRDDLMNHPRLEFQSGDAFAYEPDDSRSLRDRTFDRGAIDDIPVDWLLSDLVAFPERIIELLDRWLTERWCRQFCVTIKFRGDEDYPRLTEVKQLLHEKAGDFLLRRLNANKNEVTAIGRARW